VILLLDNHDSFVHNLARYVEELGFHASVRVSDRISLDDVRSLAPSHVILSPGPCTPGEAGISADVVRQLGATIPILGVCLGHQCIAEACGGRVVRARVPMHGSTAPVLHDGTGVLRGIPSPFMATRYHSLVMDPDVHAPGLVVTARSPDGEIMAVRHSAYPVHGVQFHPESAATQFGYRIMANFLGAATDSLPEGADLGRSAVDEWGQERGS
jgi:anthranilate synthase/aminodeoxychorismate synthase-like glutamine amidotransferase